MKKEGLNNAIRNLPEHNLNEDLWPTILSRLDEEQKLRSAIDDLPQHELHDDIWDVVERKMGAKKSVRFLRRYIIQLAAGLLVLIGMGWFMSQVIQQRVPGNIVYSEEMITIPEDSPQPFNPAIEEIDQSINQFCELRPDKCNSEIFKELQAQLTQIEQARQEVLQLLKKNSNQQLIKYSKRLQNQQVKIKKQLMEYVMKE